MKVKKFKFKLKMSKNDSSKNVSVNSNLDNESNIDHSKGIFSLIDEHKKKLEELKNKNNKSENQKYSFNKKESKTNPNLNIINRIDIDDSINLAKAFLQKSKEKTINIFNNIDNKITPYLGLHFNYDDNEENISNNITYNDNNYYSFLKQNATEPNTTKNKVINKISLLYNNSNNIIRSNSRVYTLSNKLYNDINKDLYKSKKNNYINNETNKKKGENISEIKLLKDKLKRREEIIKKLESNINSLNKENQSLKQYIIELQYNLLAYNNNNTFNKTLFNNIDESMEDNNIYDKIEKIMNSMNIFIKKIYNLFPNLGCTDNFKDLSYHKPNEVEKKLDKIWNIINDFFSLKKNNYHSNDLNESSIIDNISTIEFDKNGMKKPKYKNLIKKLENKSSKKAIKRKNKISYGLNSRGIYPYDKNKSNNY